MDDDQLMIQKYYKKRVNLQKDLIKMLEEQQLYDMLELDMIETKKLLRKLNLKK